MLYSYSSFLRKHESRPPAPPFVLSVARKGGVEALDAGSKPDPGHDPGSGMTRETLRPRVVSGRRVPTP